MAGSSPANSYSVRRSPSGPDERPSYPVPVVSLGKRSIPAWCARARTEGEATLLEERTWPGIEACAECLWFRGEESGDAGGTIASEECIEGSDEGRALRRGERDGAAKGPALRSGAGAGEVGGRTPRVETGAGEVGGRTPRVEAGAGEVERTIRCSAPGAAQRGTGLCLEVDIFRDNGTKRRLFVSLGDGLGQDVRRRIKRFVRRRPLVVDIKFVAGDADALEGEPDAFMERWRFYWNGEGWVGKPPGASLHDWNKWGRHLEFVSVSEPGSLPPEGGWPPVLDLPEGSYLLRITALEWAIGRRGERELEWSFQVLEGPHRDRRVFRRSPVRTEVMAGMVLRDLSMVLERPESELAGPGTCEFEQVLEAVRGIIVRARVVRRGAYTNLYLDARVRS